jgi:hypothetical protein
MTTAELQATADGSDGNYDTDQIDFAARARLRKRARRTQRLRRRVVVSSVALFIAAWLAVFVQLASGNDPALRRAAARANARSAAQLRASLSQVTAWGSRQAAISAHRAYGERILRARLAQARADDALVRKRLLQANARLAAAAATKAAAAQAAAGKGSTSTSAPSAASASAPSAVSVPATPSAPASTAPVAAAPAPAAAAAPAPVTTRTS